MSLHPPVTQPLAVCEKVLAKPKAVRALVLAGYGLNCDHETEYALKLAGAEACRVHVNDLVERRVRLRDFHILAFGGGFAWADDHGAGVVLAHKLRHHLGDEVLDFVGSGRFVIGICNGFQALVNLGLLPGFEPGELRREVALTYNDCGNFQNRWVTVAVADSPCVFTRGLRLIDLPARHAEGKLIASPETVDRLEAGGQIVLRYVQPDGSPAGGCFPWNPNGSVRDAAGICDPSGRVFGLMPHPEAYNHPSNHPDWFRRQWIGRVDPAHAFCRRADSWPAVSETEPGEGIAIFRNAVTAAEETFGIRE